MSKEQKTSEKTALFLYDVLDNNLEQTELNDLLKIQKAQLGPNMEIYVFLDRSGQYESEGITAFDGTYNEWLDKDGKVINGAMYGKYGFDESLGEYRITWTALDDNTLAKPQQTDSGSYKTLMQFLDWCAGQTDATHQMLFMADHGAGLCEAFMDDTAESAFIPQQIADAIKLSDANPEVLVFSACIMANAETISCFKDVVDYVVASEEETFGSKTNGSLEYHKIISEINRLSEITPKNLAQTVLDGNKDSVNILTLSSIKTDGRLTDALNEFGSASNNFTEADWTVIAYSFLKTKYSYKGYPYSDFIENLQDIIASNPSETLKTAAENAISAIKQAIAGKNDSDYHGEGVTIMNPLLPSIGNMSSYFFSEFNLTPAGNDTNWSKFVFRLYDYAKAAGLIPDIQKASEEYAVLPTAEENDLMYITSDNENDNYYIADTSYVGGVCGEGAVFKNNCQLDTINSKWFTFNTGASRKATKYLSVTFDFESLSDIEASVTLSIYDLEDQTDNFIIIGEKLAEFSGSGSITIDLSHLAEDCTYFVRMDTNAPMSYSITFNNNEFWTNKDFYDVNKENHELASAVNLDSKVYYGGLVVSADTRKEVLSDYFKASPNQTLEFKVVIDGISGNGEINENTLTVSMLDEDGNILENAEYSSEDHSYTLFDALDGNYYRISTTGKKYVYYSIQLTNDTVQYMPKTVKSTSILPIEGKDNSFSLGWISGRSLPRENSTLQFSPNIEFDEVLELTIANMNAAKVYNLGSDMEWQVRCDELWEYGKTLTTSSSQDKAKIVAANRDYTPDIFFANKQGIWTNEFVARNTDTGEKAKLEGKNKICDIFRGTKDGNVLLLTDDDNGDVFFADDIYSDSAEDAAKTTARFSQINEIRAGAGDDIIDMSSKRFDTDSNGITLRGGSGNDVLWAAGNGAAIFGDSGDDRITGTHGNDILVGGSGDDALNGNGGDDTFLFCDNWGKDTVSQAADGKVTLWFASGSEENWNASTLTYTDGANSVAVNGILSDNVTLKFGDDKSEQYKVVLSSGAFNAFSSERIFVKRSEGMLA